MTLVAPEHRPTLREVLAPLPRAVRWAVVGVLALALVALVVALTGGATSDGNRFVRSQPIAFNLRAPSSFVERPAQGDELLRIERPGLDSMTVEPLTLPAYHGDVGGILPIVAARELVTLKQRFPGLEPVEEGKARINKVAGYSLAFRASRDPRMYGRLVLLPQPGEREGVKLLLLANPDAGAGKASDVGTSGQLKTPYRSFRFGTEGP
ncbi:MAG TPA: hypothetical protein VNS09_22400 [Solirubrobacter sp.]|nr:hypothetical protein [Solirubrobacter sp.]